MRRITSRSHPASCVFILMSFCFSGIKIYFSYCTRQWASPRHYHFIQHWTLLVLQPFLTPTVSPSSGGPLPLIYVPLDNACVFSPAPPSWKCGRGSGPSLLPPLPASPAREPHCSRVLPTPPTGLHLLFPHTSQLTSFSLNFFFS